MSILGNNLLAQYYAQQEALPNEYRRVEYLESTRTQYIDTGFIPNGNSSARIKSANHNITSSSYATILGSRQAYKAKQFAVWSDSDVQAYARFDYANNVQVDSGVNIIQDSIYTFFISPTSYEVCDNNNNIIFSRNHNQESFTCTQNLLLFCMNNNGTPAFGGEHSIYSSQVWDDGRLIRNFIPCIRKSDGKPGLYDLCKSICPLTGTPFYINPGTGEFTTP